VIFFLENTNTDEDIDLTCSIYETLKGNFDW